MNYENTMKKYIVFIFILLVSGFFRFYQLGGIPPSPDWDETALGYNAYSILKTGKDEYGNFLPLSIRSFDDYKPPLYTYLTIPSVALFGLSTWSTRLPSAIMGILAVIGTYFLVKELMSMRQGTMSRGQMEVDNKKTKSNNAHCSLSSVTCLPLLSSLLLAISPWHIQFSRIAFEANIGVTINIWAVTLFLIGLRKKIMLLISAFLFGLGMYAYHSERIFLPFLVLLLLIFYRRELFKKSNKKILLATLVVGFITVLPLFPVLFNKTAVLRLRGTSSFTDQIGLLGRNVTKIEEDRNNHDLFGEVLDNRRFVFAKTILSGYLSHFSLKWLFLTGDNPRHHAPDMGLLYFWELPFFLYGLFYLLKTRSQEPGTKLLFGWFLISPIAASVTTGLPHAIRTLVFLPTFQIFTGVGIMTILSSIKYSSHTIASANKQVSSIKRVSIIFLLFSIFFLALFNIAYYFVQYFFVLNKEYSQYWQYGYKEAVEYTESVKGKYKKIVVSTGLEQSYMFYLFFTKYDPVKYLSAGGTKSGSFDERGNAFDIYEFRPLHWKTEQFDGKTLYVGSPSEIPHGNNAHITFLNGDPAIEIKDRMD